MKSTETHSKCNGQWAQRRITLIPIHIVSGQPETADVDGDTAFVLPFEQSTDPILTSAF